MPSPKKPFKNDDFLRIFSELDDLALISPAQWGLLSGQSIHSVYSARKRGMLPQPAIDKNRLLRWTVGQYRAWARGLADAAPAKPRGGRPRKDTGQQPGGAA